jgi:hypothetical protein
MTEDVLNEWTGIVLKAQGLVMDDMAKRLEASRAAILDLMNLALRAGVPVADVQRAIAPTLGSQPTAELAHEPTGPMEVDAPLVASIKASDPHKTQELPTLSDRELGGEA